MQNYDLIMYIRSTLFNLFVYKNNHLTIFTIFNIFNFKLILKDVTHQQTWLKSVEIQCLIQLKTDALFNAGT